MPLTRKKQVETRKFTPLRKSAINRFSIHVLLTVNDTEANLRIAKIGQRVASASCGERPMRIEVVPRSPPHHPADSSAAVGCIDRLHSGRDINNRGEIIGTILESDREKTAIWSPDYGVRILNDLMPKCVAFGINDHGAIVGFYPEKTGGLRAFQWSEQGGFVDLSELTGRRFTRANAINNAGEIAGQIVSDGAERAILWRPGLGFVDLHPHDADVSSAFGLNDRGQVVGYCRMERGSFAFVWSKEHGMINLNQLLSPSSDWSFQRAVAINDNGEIVGLGRRSEKFRSFFLKL